MTEENGWGDGYGDEVYELPSLKPMGSISEQVIQSNPAQKNTSYMFMTQQQIFDEQKRLVDQVINNLGISSALASALLIKCGWNPDDVN